jgi:glycosyltransferase involved in cell wall biosynthesis
MTALKNKLNLMLVSTTYPANDEDWRGRFIANLVSHLGRIENVRLSFWGPPGSLPGGAIDRTIPAERRWLSGLMRQGGIAHLLRTNRLRAVIETCRLLASLRRAYLRPPRVDIYHINWFQNIIPLWGTTSPVVIGVLGSDYKLLTLKGTPALLKSILKKRKSIIAPNSEWMVPELSRLFGDIAEIRPIPFGIDRRWYKISRQPLGTLQLDWIAVFRMTKKKLGPLLEWGEGLFDDRHRLHLIGPMQEEIELPDWAEFHGPASPDELCENWFPRAAGLITLSQHDEGRPQVMLEGMAASLPVVVSDIPAHLDIVNHKENGWVVRSEADFNDAINSLADIEKNIDMGNQAHQWVKANIGTWQDCADRYLHAYCDLIEASR